MRQFITIVESQEPHLLYHGSSYYNIDKFEFKGLRHRTGTPGTLSFTTSLDTAKIYGKYVYTVRVGGNFGDYRNHDDCDANFNWRWPKHRDWVMGRVPDAIEEEVEMKFRTEIASGYYALWENVGLWEACGWDGAWCHESGSANLIVRDTASIEIVDRPEPPSWD